MNELFFVLCALAVASASLEHRTRGRQTLVPYSIPFGHVANPYSTVLPPNLSPTSLPYVIKAQSPSAYSGAWPFPSRPYSTSKYNPSHYESPSTYSPQSHEMYTPPPSYWPYPTQVFYASQYHPLHPPHRPDTPVHHTEHAHYPSSYPSPSYSTAKPVTPYDAYHIEISPQQHMIHNHEEANLSISPLHPSYPHDNPIYHNMYEESNHSPSHPHDTTPHLHHGVHYFDTHGEHPLHSTPKPPHGILTTEHLLQFLQSPLNVRGGSSFPPPPPPQPPRTVILRPLEIHSEGASGITPEASDGDTMQSLLPLTRSNTEAVEDREDSSRHHVLWETMYHPKLWGHKWYPKWDLNLHHLWNTKRWMPWKKEHAAPHHDSHVALGPWDHVKVDHAPPPSSNPYVGLSHHPVYPSKQPLEDYFEANRPHTLDTFLQPDEPWSNRHLLEQLLQDNEQVYQHTRDPTQYYHHRPTMWYNTLGGLNNGRQQGHRQFAHRPWVGAQGPDASPGAPEGRLMDEPEPSQLFPPLQEEEDRLLEAEPISRSSSVNDVIEYEPEGRVQTEQWLPPDLETLSSSTSSDDVIDAPSRDSEAIGQPSVHPWLPPSYLPSMTPREGQTRAIVNK